MPTVSALIPTYNRCEFVEGAVETVLGQTYGDLEAIVVDDCSTDRTPEVLGRYEENDRVRTVRNERNRGIAASHNRAAEIADGEYLCILDDDDRWHPTKVAKQVELMERRDDTFAVIYTGGVATKGGRVIHRYRPRLRGDIYPQVLRRFELDPHSGHMIRSTHFDAVGGFDPSLPRGVDWELSIRLAKEYKYDCVREPLVERKIHGDNVSEDSRREDVSSMILEKHGEKLRRYPDVERAFRSNWAERRAWRALELGDRRKAVSNLLEALRTDPTLYRALLLAIGCGGKAAYENAQRVKWSLTRLKSNVSDS